MGEQIHCVTKMALIKKVLLIENKIFELKIKKKKNIVTALQVIRSLAPNFAQLSGNA